MKNKKINAVRVWKQLEDVLVPRLGLTLAERAVYSHLLRHSRLEDRLRLRFSILWLARGNRLSAGSVRLAVRRLVAKGGAAPGRTHASRPRRGGPAAGGDSRRPS
jgi:hypothetical protein